MNFQQPQRLFGFKYKENPEEQVGKVSPIPPNVEDGVAVAAGGIYGYTMEMDNTGLKDYDLIRKYRCMALHPEVDSAVEDIINEAIVSDTNDTPVTIDLTNLDVSEEIKVIIREEFQYILHLLDFNKNCHEIFRRWYVDGRLYYHKVIDPASPEKGITDLRYVDALKIRPIREYRKVDPNKMTSAMNGSYAGQDNLTFGMASRAFPNIIDEYFLYNKKGINYLGAGSPSMNGSAEKEGTVKLAKDSIAYITSGLVDGNTGQVLSYLNKAIKPLNQLNWMEDAIVIYRMARAPERRLFYIDVGNLPKQKAEQYLNSVMSRYRTKITYDQNTGEIRDNKKFMSMLEDYWLPRREGGRGTEVKTLEGGQNLGKLEDLNYFKEKVYKSLNVPFSRMNGGETGVQIGKSDITSRDEVKFSKFVGRMRKKFSYLFTDILKTQLVLKGVTSPKEFDSMREHIQFDFIYDNHFSELKDLEILQNKLMVAGMMEPYVGKYYSVFKIRNEILGQSDGEIKEIDRQISYERNVGIIPMPPANPEEGGDGEGGGENELPPDDMDINGDPYNPEQPPV